MPFTLKMGHERPHQTMFESMLPRRQEVRPIAKNHSGARSRIIQWNVEIILELDKAQRQLYMRKCQVGLDQNCSRKMEQEKLERNRMQRQIWKRGKFFSPQNSILFVQLYDFKVAIIAYDKRIKYNYLNENMETNDVICDWQKGHGIDQLCCELQAMQRNWKG